MTDNNDSEGIEEIEQAIAPQIDTYEIGVNRVFEVDFPQQQIKQLIDQTGADTPEEALEAVMKKREMESVEPHQKLIGVNVQVDESSND